MRDEGRVKHNDKNYSQPGDNKRAPRHQCQTEVQGQWWPPGGPEC